MSAHETLRSTYNELLDSHSYLEMPDESLYERIMYWKEQQTSAERSPRGREAARIICLRLSLEITERKGEESHLEEQFGFTTPPTIPDQRVSEQPQLDNNLA